MRNLVRNDRSNFRHWSQHLLNSRTNLEKFCKNVTDYNKYFLNYLFCIYFTACKRLHYNERYAY